MTSLIWAVIVGFVVGTIAKFFTPGHQPIGFVITALLGIAGSVFVTWLGQFFHFYHEGEKAGFLFSIVGAIILLYLYDKFFRQRSM